MSNSIQAIKDKLKNVAKAKNMEFNSVMRFYMYDRFIERLSKSKYRDNFILKGGFYLSTLFGIDSRTTMDIDTAITKAEFTDENIIAMIEEIIAIDVDDGVNLSISNTSQIREEDEYGGLRITLLFRLESYKDSFHIDIATGDPIYPGPSDYGYQSLIGNEKYKVWAYSIETILSEKIETIFSKLETSSRMKDYYDIYLIYNNEYTSLNKDNFCKAAQKTFKKRGFNGNLKNGLEIIRNSEVLAKYWDAYIRKNKFTSAITFEDTIKCLEVFVDILTSSEK